MATVATLRDLTEALIEAATETEKLETVTSDLERFFSFCNENTETKKILASPAYEIVEKKSIMQDLADQMGFMDISTNFICLTIEFGKFKTLLYSQQTIIRKLRKISDNLIAEITLAKEPKENELNELSESLKKLTGSDVELNIRIDPEIIGGIVARVEDKVFDGSIKTQLKKVKQILSVK